MEIWHIVGWFDDNLATDNSGSMIFGINYITYVG